VSEPETTADSWYEATRVASRERGSLNYELDADVCVIGAGYSGPEPGQQFAAASALRRGKFHLISPGAVSLPDTALGFERGVRVRDPDGHVIQLVER